MSETNEIAVFEDGDGILLFGDESQLAILDGQPDVVSRALSPQTLSKAGQALTTLGEAQAQSGRWLKMTQESAALVRKLGPSHAKADGLMTGVVRADKGRIFKHLKFENVALVTPAAPMMLGAIATQLALDAALDEITTCLERMDVKLDRLLKQHKSETLGVLGGVTLAIDEAHAIYSVTGVVSDTTWSKVQSNSTALATMQAEAIAQLSALAEEIHEAGDDPDDLDDATKAARDDGKFWLGVLGRTMVLENKQYILELAHVAEENADQLDAHRQGIAVARDERLKRIGASLVTIDLALRRVAALPNLRRVTNPFKVGRTVSQVNQATRDIGEFAAAVELQGLGSGELANTPWSAAVRQLIDDGAEMASSTGSRFADQVRSLSQQLGDARDDATLRKAAKVQEKRKAKQLESDNDGSDHA